jgi:hypothetical protein
MGDGMLFLFGIIFFFILWVVSGGPTKPISFAGPFITPITNVGQTQSAYGPQVALGGTLSAGGVSVGVEEKKTSPYANEVFLNHSINQLNSNPNYEYLSLQVSGSNKQSVPISGWKLVSKTTGESAVIPQGVPLLTLGTVTLQPILLNPGATATITTGLSPVNVSYAENACINLLSDQQNYMGCVTGRRNDPNFIGNSWRIYLNKKVQIWKSSGDTIELLDSGGKVVDSYSY